MFRSWSHSGFKGFPCLQEKGRQIVGSQGPITHDVMTDPVVGTSESSQFNFQCVSLYSNRAYATVNVDSYGGLDEILSSPSHKAVASPPRLVQTGTLMKGLPLLDGSRRTDPKYSNSEIADWEVTSRHLHSISKEVPAPV